MFETTLCTAIEAGYLEQEVMLLAESLRRFGGIRSDTPLVAVRPRKGPRIARATRKRLHDLNVHLVEDGGLSVSHSWWATANKPPILEYVEENSRTPNVTWIDGDMMVLAEPDSFAPPEGYDFVARAGESADVASDGSDDKVEFWQRLCGQFNLDFHDFEKIVSFPEGKPIKAYWQAGLFTYRRGLGFASRFRQIKEAVLDGDIASKFAGTYHTDQVALALAAHGLRTAQFNPRMNFNVNPLDKAGSTKLPIAEVQIMQYHGSLWPDTYPWLRSVLTPLPNNRADMVDRYAPLGNGGLITRAARKLHHLPRQRKIRDYETRVVRL